MPFCELCGSQHTLNNNLIRHKKEVHSEVEKELHSCKQCNFVATKRNLNQYVTTVHSQNLLQCDLCNETFSKKANLNRNANSRHKSDKTHSCPICDKSFSRKDHMKVHLRGHSKSTEPKPSKKTKCHFCGMDYTTAKILK